MKSQVHKISTVGCLLEFLSRLPKDMEVKEFFIQDNESEMNDFVEIRVADIDSKACLEFLSGSLRSKEFGTLDLDWNES